MLVPASFSGRGHWASFRAGITGPSSRGGAVGGRGVSARRLPLVQYHQALDNGAGLAKGPHARWIDRCRDIVVSDRRMPFRRAPRRAPRPAPCSSGSSRHSGRRPRTSPVGWCAPSKACRGAAVLQGGAAASFVGGGSRRRRLDVLRAKSFAAPALAGKPGP
ncbi:hypothetical protein M885DRAFT_513996 [Pelagophyceae sp. CCMP2097]|nr:hypothetical protein M885DRAFT_513996 [Pelagophyceae sp. CCMP2097]